MADGADLEDLARRYLDLWQDQMSALAADKEFAEALTRLLTSMGRTGAGAAVWGPGLWAVGVGSGCGPLGQMRLAARSLEQV